MPPGLGDLVGQRHRVARRVRGGDQFLRARGAPSLVGRALGERHLVACPPPSWSAPPARSLAGGVPVQVVLAVRVGMVSSVRTWDRRRRYARPRRSRPTEVRGQASSARQRRTVIGIPFITTGPSSSKRDVGQLVADAGFRRVGEQHLARLLPGRRCGRRGCDVVADEVAAPCQRVAMVHADADPKGQPGGAVYSASKRHSSSKGASHGVRIEPGEPQQQAVAEFLDDSGYLGHHAADKGAPASRARRARPHLPVGLRTR